MYLLNLCSPCLCCSYIHQNIPVPVLYSWVSQKWISSSFPHGLLVLKRGPRLRCVRMWRTVYFLRTSGEVMHKLAGDLNALSCLVPFPLIVLGCPSLTRRWKGPRGQTLEIVSDCRKRNEISAVSCVSGPKRGSNYCQENFLYSRDEFKGDQSFHSQGWRRPPDCCYQNSFPHPEKREIKDTRRKEEQTSLPLSE